jgi:hypothetical protein
MSTVSKHTKFAVGFGVSTLLLITPFSLLHVSTFRGYCKLYLCWQLQSLYHLVSLPFPLIQPEDSSLAARMPLKCDTCQNKTWKQGISFNY